MFASHQNRTLPLSPGMSLCANPALVPPELLETVRRQIRVAQGARRLEIRLHSTGFESAGSPASAFRNADRKLLQHSGSLPSWAAGLITARFLWHALRRPARGSMARDTGCGQRRRSADSYIGLDLSARQDERQTPRIDSAAPISGAISRTKILKAQRAASIPIRSKRNRCR